MTNPEAKESEADRIWNHCEQEEIPPALYDYAKRLELKVQEAERAADEINGESNRLSKELTELRGTYESIQSYGNEKAKNQQEQIQRLESTIAKEREEAKRPCEWSEDGEDSATWKTGCGKYYCFEDSTPKESDQDFCPGCGHPVVVSPAKGLEGGV